MHPRGDDGRPLLDAGKIRPMGELYTYLHTLFTHLAFVLSTGPFLVDRLITWFWAAGRAWLDENAGQRRKKIGLWIVAAGLFAAGFLSWRDEYRRNPVTPARNLSAAESLCITENIRPIHDQYRYLGVISTPDDDSSLYAVDFYEAFRAAGIEAGMGNSSRDSRDQHDVMISVKDPNNPPEKVKILVGILEGKCRVPIRLVRWRYGNQPDEFVMFIAPPRR
jgi:hypothetical protein